MISAALLVVIAVLAVIVGRSPLFAISEIKVTGVDGSQAAEVRAVADVQVGQNLLDADLAAAEARIEALPWVRRASFNQVPPSLVVAEVTPRTAAAVVRTADGSWLVDASGVVIAGGERDGTPIVEVRDLAVPPLGQPVDHEGLRSTLAIMGSLPASLEDRVLAYRVEGAQVIATLDTADRLAAQSTLDVVFGSAQRIADKAAVTLAMIEAVAERQATVETPEPVVLDVRAPENPVLRS